MLALEEELVVTREDLVQTKHKNNVSTGYTRSTGYTENTGHTGSTGCAGKSSYTWSTGYTG